MPEDPYKATQKAAGAPARPFRVGAAPSPAGHSDGEKADLDGGDFALDRDAVKIADASKPRSAPDNGSKPFRLK